MDINTLINLATRLCLCGKIKEALFINKVIDEIIITGNKRTVLRKYFR